MLAQLVSQSVCNITSRNFSLFVYHFDFRFSLWPPAVMHFAWNELNPLLYGSIYTQHSGCLVRGEQWLINGEGVAGCLAAIPVMLYVVANI